MKLLFPFSNEVVTTLVKEDENGGQIHTSASLLHQFAM
jgi:hypothetical protein